MHRDGIQPGNDSGVSYERIREALRIEKDRRWGEVGKIEADLGYSPGYLAKICRGQESIRVDRLLRLLQRMEVDPGRFFASALDARPNNDSLLEEIERLGKIDRKLDEIEKAIREVALAAVPEATPKPIDVSALIADLVSCKGSEQRRRIGSARKYRHPAIAAAYLEHLDNLRYSNIPEARLSALVVAVKLIPRLAAPRPERLVLLLKAIGIYASCHRQQGKFATAARAFRSALRLARDEGLQEATVELLQRAAYVLSDHGKYGAAIQLLDEAIVICVDLDLQIELGTIMVDRGTALQGLGNFRASNQTFNRALNLLQKIRLLPKDSPRIQRNRLVAHQMMARNHQALGELEAAELALAGAVKESDFENELFRAHLVWDHGILALARQDYDFAEERLRSALEMFNQLGDRNKALVALDLTKALKAQGKHVEAGEMATQMAEFLMAFRGNPVAEAAISDLMQTSLQGRLTLEAIEKAQLDLKAAQDRPPASVEPV